LENLIRRELRELQIMLCRFEQHSLWNESNYLAPGNLRAACFRLFRDEIIRHMQRCALSIHEIHRDLRLAVHFHPESLHILEPARRLAHSLRDCLGKWKLRRVAKVDVVRYKERSSANSCCACGRMNCARTKI